MKPVQSLLVILGLAVGASAFAGQGTIMLVPGDTLSSESSHVVVIQVEGKEFDKLLKESTARIGREKVSDITWDSQSVLNGVLENGRPAVIIRKAD